MQFPVYFHLGPWPLHAHWVFETAAWTIAFWLYSRRRRHEGDVIDARSRTILIVAAAAGGVLGSRLLYLLEDPAHTAAHWDLAYLLGGKTIVGGLIGGLIAVESVKRRLGIVVATGDLLALPLVVGIGIGRIGCFLSGLEDRSYGIATALPWGVDFGDGIARHPTQLYELLFLTTLGAALVSLRGRLPAVGDQFKVLMVGYLAWRFAVDFLKPSVSIAGLSAIQWACAAALAYYAPHVQRMMRLRPASGAAEVVRG